ncbi:MAG: SMI1/KNR4 family protein [Saprospiraceae bacterium]
MNLWIKYQLISILLLSSIVKNEINAQSNVDMNENYIILKDEFPITEERVKKFENEKGIKLPQDYRNFILEFNGGVVVPNYPISEKLKTEIFPIERFYSLQDIELGVIANQRERMEYVIDDINSGKEYFEKGNRQWGFDIEFEKLIFIGVCERGTLHLYCGENGYGEIWYSNYSGGEGLENTGLKSFTELLNSLSSLDEEWIFDKSNPAYENWESDKVFTFNYYFYWEDDIQEKSLQRFKEVLASYGDPNKVHKIKETDVVNYYLNYPIVLKSLIDSGAKFLNN